MEHSDIPQKRHNVEELEGVRIADRYIVTKRIGKGGMGVVYLAEHVSLKRNVCIKVLNPALIDDESAVERFEREARSLSRLQHPNIVTIFDFGRDGDLAYIVMEYAQGETLSKFIKRLGALDLDTFLPIAVQILKGIGEAHKLGLIHRDIKPANIIIGELEGETNFVKILDFGLAKLAQGQEDVTKEQQLVGSASYMAPEQIIKGQSDPRTDVYALGVMFYQMLAGKKPFVGPNDNVILYKHINEQPAPLAAQLKPDQNVPDALCQVIEQAMNKDPEKRPQTALTFLDAISYALDAPQLRAGFSSMSLAKIDLQKITEDAETHFIPPETRHSLSSMPAVDGGDSSLGANSNSNNALPAFSGASENTLTGVTTPSLIIQGGTLLQADDVIKAMNRQNSDRKFFIFVVIALFVLAGTIVAVMLYVKNTSNAPVVVTAAPESEKIKVNFDDYSTEIQTYIDQHDFEKARTLFTSLKNNPNLEHNVDNDKKIAELEERMNNAENQYKGDKAFENGDYDEALAFYNNIPEPIRSEETINNITYSKTNRPGSLSFTFEPAEIEFFLGDQKMDTAPDSLKLSPGKHAITVKADGYHDYKTDITVEAGESRQLHIKLTKQAAEKPASGNALIGGGSGNKKSSSGTSSKSGSSKKRGGLLGL